MFICRKNIYFQKYCIMIILCVAKNTIITKTRILYHYDTLLCLGILCTKTLFGIINIFLVCEVRKGNGVNVIFQRNYTTFHIGHLQSRLPWKRTSCQGGNKQKMKAENLPFPVIPNFIGHQGGARSSRFWPIISWTIQGFCTDILAINIFL